ncbi:MAG: bifunctional diaminohydroxyphosphoribosylaminopyrimidine deaminase/5-amino-6-(5-phosphoribosylamino)uracil reductase RibD [Proteobacteria bacterium]|nr:bifunctional diaminohydroxyphosphoribosylaminopyrimidine deaminase/5-amino-6-(5-phosphoribosylamino)uracil reductase RibD [Pseudomonadota bacterium]
MDTESIMRKAIQLALKAEFQTCPNPMVGSILVDADGRILSEGYHRKAGTPHAEVNALQWFAEVPEDATLFVTLEPCCHQGRTPPCTDLIIDRKVRNVVVGCRDPDPRVAGNGIRLLKENGITVTVGVCEGECRDINRVFNKHIVHHLPYITVKAAISLDGKIAMPSGESKWITGESARAEGHRLRSQHQAIAVGSQTLIKDDPKLTDRKTEEPRQPIRIVFSSDGKIPLDSSFVRVRDTRRIMMAGNGIEPSTLDRLQAEDIDVFVAESPKPGIKWSLDRMYREGICSLLLEGGAELIASFVKERMLDQVKIFLSGKIVGSADAPAWSGEIGIKALADVPRLDFGPVENLGEDLLITGYLRV